MRKIFITIATENDIQSNLLRKLKSEFLDNIQLVFGNKCKENFKDKLVHERKEKTAYAQMVV